MGITKTPLGYFGCLPVKDVVAVHKYLGFSDTFCVILYLVLIVGRVQLYLE